MRPLVHSLVDHPAEQNFDNRNRQYDGYDHHHHTARRDHRLGVSDDARRRDRSDVHPARDNGGLLDIYPAIDPRGSHRFLVKVTSLTSRQASWADGFFAGLFAELYRDDLFAELYGSDHVAV